ncbi:hypothetical protein H5410_062031 [Solanum commersonii]|uniref:Uncharacterized protein n=1 Tax=Solanum commersonii TaxID=4109 RepID=A0A9J5W9K9_SOLCO|nr:hypothetical protein H5410_062031 [Solanum commersonii]
MQGDINDLNMLIKKESRSTYYIHYFAQSQKRKFKRLLIWMTLKLVEACIKNLIFLELDNR